MMRIARCLAPLLLLSAAGCFKLSRTSPELQQYVLSGARSSTAAASASDSNRLTIGLRRMDLAPYLTVPAILMRRGAHEIVTSNFHRWGEGLGEGINHTVAAYLTNAPPVARANVAPWAARTGHDYLVQLHVLRFEGVIDSAATTGAVHVLTTWDIIRPIDGAMLLRGTTDFRGGRFTVGDYEGLVAELSSSLGRVAQDIRTCLGKFRSDSAPPPAC